TNRSGGIMPGGIRGTGTWGLSSCIYVLVGKSVGGKICWQTVRAGGEFGVITGLVPGVL
nr:hypothetical protein [Tanacetum cinerariifolium]